MSVAGFDVGNCTSCVALARRRGVDVILNSESSRETPAVVSFGEKMRHVGVDGAARLTMNVKNTVLQVKRLIGRRFQDPAVQADLGSFMFKVAEGPDGRCLIHVRYLNEVKVLSPEQVFASLLKDLKKTAEKDQGSVISDCVVAVPAYFAEAERQAMLTAANLAGLKCLRLMNETTAAALNWGIFKPDLPEDQPMHVAFVDLGNSSMQVAIVAFKKGGLEVKAHAWDRSLGGRDLDAALMQHFAAEFKAKTGLDIYSNPKAIFRMRTQAEKCRLALTINTRAPISVECLMEDTDFRSEVTREKFEELAAPVLDRVRAPLNEALQMARLTAKDMAAVELVGAATRTPSIVKTVSETFQQEPKRTMNSKECVSKGCSLQAAMLSPIFQVRNFDVKDVFPFRVAITWDKDGGKTTSQLFGEVAKDSAVLPQHFPSVKVMNFHKLEPFSLSVDYMDSDNLGAAERHIADVKVLGAHAAPPGATQAACKVQFELNLHGLVRCVQVTHTHKVEVEEAAAAGSGAKEGEGAAKAESGPAGDASKGEGAAGVAPMETDGTEVSKEGEVVKKVKKISKDAEFTQVSTSALPSTSFQRLLEEEGQMAAADALQTATMEAKNSFEEYMYSLRDKLEGECREYVATSDREALLEELNELSNWLYEDGEDESKSVYDGKLAELRRKGEPILLRFTEAAVRDHAVQSLSNLCQHNLQWCGTTDERFAHIGAADREIVRKECTEALNWLDNQLKLQAMKAKTEDPAFLVAHVTDKQSKVNSVCTPVINKPVPPPPKPAAADKPADKEGTATGQATPDNGAAPMDEDKPADKAPSESAPMDE